MLIEVRHFADAREAAGCDRETLELAAGGTAADAFAALRARHPRLAALEGKLRFAIGEEFVAQDAPLDDGATLVLIPPVGGG